MGTLICPHGQDQSPGLESLPLLFLLHCENCHLSLFALLPALMSSTSPFLTQDAPDLTWLLLVGTAVAPCELNLGWSRRPRWTCLRQSLWPLYHTTPGLALPHHSTLLWAVSIPTYPHAFPGSQPQFLVLQVCLLLFNWSCSLVFSPPRSLPTVCPPLKAALSFWGLSTPRPIPSMVVCSCPPPAWWLVNTGSFVSYGEPKAAREGVCWETEAQDKVAWACSIPLQVP